MIPTTLAAQFYSKLPVVVRNDIEYQVSLRKKRAKATFANLSKFQDILIKKALKSAPLIEDKFRFAETRAGHRKPTGLMGLDHHILMCDSSLEMLCGQLMQKHVGIMDSLQWQEDSESEKRTYLDVLQAAFLLIRESLGDVCIVAPSLKKKFDSDQEEEREIEIAIRRCICPDWMMRKFLFLRAQYIEYAQIAMGRVGKKANQRKYVSAVSFANWKTKQREALDYIEAMAVMNVETGEVFNLDEVIKRTTANPENRRIEMMVRSRGNEERALDLGYEGVFVNWTLPSKYHPNSHKWNGATVKEGHQNLMNQWKRARARLAKDEIDYFGFRVAEPHKDGCSHAHMFLFCPKNKVPALVHHLREVAIEEDYAELGNDITPRFTVKYADPSQGGATAYIAKYISKNINGKHMPETEAEESAYRVRAWASTHRIRQFQAFGSPSVSLWRQLRRADATDTAFDEQLEELRQAADNSRWKLFCELAKNASIEYETDLGKYGETTRRVIGFSWLGEIVETCKAQYALVLKKDVSRLAFDLKKTRSGLSWSTENNCNSGLSEALMTITGWSYQGVQCLIAPLLRGAKVPIDRYQSVAWKNNRLVTY
ncbi:replication endonuclease [Vibrio scophthalmi]|uniref:replication endonuclease n=1 Tax=Vibrio scophthalmi TaxID=45658 RepID=UPI003AB02B66